MVSVVKGATHKAAAQEGFRAEAFDKFRIPGVTDLCFGCSNEDLTVEAGFQCVLRLVLRLRSGGLVDHGDEGVSLFRWGTCWRQLLRSSWFWHTCEVCM